MHLPDPELAIVDDPKVRDYLLSRTHPTGRFKAAFFAALGFSDERWEILRDALFDIARTGDAVRGQTSDFGIKYEVRALLTGPSGRSGAVITIWLVPHGHSEPRFVTAFPG